MPRPFIYKDHADDVPESPPATRLHSSLSPVRTVAARGHMVVARFVHELVRICGIGVVIDMNVKIPNPSIYTQRQLPNALMQYSSDTALYKLGDRYGTRHMAL